MQNNHDRTLLESCQTVIHSVDNAAQPPQHDEADHITGVLQPVKGRASPFVKLPVATLAAKPLTS